MRGRRPAWSTQFAREALPALDPVHPNENVTADWAWGGGAGAGVRVAVIDSGIDADHPAVGAVNGYVSIQEDPTGRLVYDTARHDDAYGHGTACAGIIRAMAPACELYSVKVLGPQLTGRGAVFAAGLRWAIEHDMHICNLSLGTTRKDFFGTLHELTDLAFFRKVMLVTAASNMPVPSFPSMYASVISVASHDRPDATDPYLFYYNPQPPVEFGALGINVRVPWLRGGWITATGNSFAAPRISGLIAQILSKHPGLALFQVKVILRALAANVAREPE